MQALGLVALGNLVCYAISLGCAATATSLQEKKEYLNELRDQVFVRPGPVIGEFNHIVYPGYFFARKTVGV